MKLINKQKEFKITNQSEEFKGSEYDDFEIVVRNLTQKEESELFSIFAKSTEDDNKEAEYAAKRVSKCIISHSEFEGLDGPIDLKNWEEVLVLLEYEAFFMNKLLKQITLELQKLKKK